MATAKRLPSGNYRCRVYSHTDASGKRIYESFTASTKAQAELMARKFANDNDRRRSADLTVKEAVDKYIEANRNTLSASTLRGYYYDAKRLDYFGNIKIRKICSMDLQEFIAYLEDKKYNPKTIKNTYSIVITALDACDVDTNFKVNLPRRRKNRRTSPEDNIVSKLLHNANPTMKKVILLAAFHSLRRSEICGLRYGDIKGNICHVHTATVEGMEGVVHQDLTKTYESDREILLEDWELEILGRGLPNQPIIPITPGTVTDNFKRLTVRLGIENVTLHTLRAYFASTAVNAGVPDLYAAHMGGWTEGSAALKKVYQRKVVSMDEQYKKRMNDYFKKNVL